jgi:RNA polymerase sigma-70 factor (ECF subfamily)
MRRARTTADLDIDGLRERRSEAVDAWFETFADAVYGFVVHRVGGDPELAADVAQDTFVTALRRIDQYDATRGAMFPWLTYIARNCVRKALRAERRCTSGVDEWLRVDRRLHEALGLIGDDPLPVDLLERQETAELVRGVLVSMPPRYRTALERRYYEDMTVREIAVAEGTTEGAAKVLLHRARQAFQAAFLTLVDDLGEGRVPS